MRDTVDYRESLGPLGQVAHGLFVRSALERIFDFRRDAAHRLLGPSPAATPSSAARSRGLAA
jgi:hypothetical protein